MLIMWLPLGHMFSRLAVSRALFMANPNCHDKLQKAFCLFEDLRMHVFSGYPAIGSKLGFYTYMCVWCVMGVVVEMEVAVVVGSCCVGEAGKAHP